MSKSLPEHPELVDTLYNLQALREMSGEEPELALINGAEWEEDCSVIIDQKTGDRIVVTKLPLDQSDFDGATVWMSNVKEGVHLETDKYQVTSKDIIFWVDKAANARYYNPHNGNFSSINPEFLAKRLDMPQIKPIPVSEYDPRYVPTENEIGTFEQISTPNTDTYTLAAGIYDTQLEQDATLIARASGIIESDNNQTTTYDLEILEVSTNSLADRITEFDREFVLLVRTGDELKFKVKPWGSSELLGVGKIFKISVLREGFIVDMAKGGKEVHCVPSKPMARFIDRMLHNAEQFSS